MYEAASTWPFLLRPLPRPVAPFRNEIVTSYVIRLAVANHLKPQDLTGYLAGSRFAAPRMDWLAVVSGLPVEVLQDRLAAKAPQDRPHRLSRREQLACRFCAARRGAQRPVSC